MMQGDYQPTIQFNLTPLKQKHQDLFCALYGDAQVMAFIGAPMLRDAVADYFLRLLDKVSQTDSGVLYRVIEVLTDQGKFKLAGFVRMAEDKIEIDQSAVRIGTLLLPEFQGQNLAYQAQKRLMKETEVSYPGQVFTAYCHRDNKRAHRLYQRLGFYQIRQLLYNHIPTIQWLKEVPR